MATKTPPMAPAQGNITPESIEAKLHLTAMQSAMLQRIVLAGMRVMFSPQTHQLMLKELQGPLPLPQKLGQGIAGLISLLFQESHRSLPPNLLIPAGMILLAHAADFLRKAGQPVSDQDIAQGIDAMIGMIMHATGVDPDKVAQMGAGGKLPPPVAAPAAAGPGAASLPASPASTPAPGPGMLQ